MNKNKIDLIKVGWTCCCFLFILGLTFQISYAQVRCVNDKVVCDNGVSPVCTVTYPIPYCDCYGNPLCINNSFYIDLITSGFSCSSIPLSVLPAASCPEPLPITYSCDPGYTTCPPNIAPTDPGGRCCVDGCCPSDPTKCKCQFTNECSPNCPTTHTCDPGFISCPNNRSSTCCSITVGCCPSDPTKCKCPNSNQCIPNCPATYTCETTGYTHCPDDRTSGVCCKHGCCPSDPTKCKCPDSNQCSPNCTVAEPPPTTYECKDGYIICPTNTTPNAICCLNGCCPSNPSQCKCSNSDECYPNCSTNISEEPNSNPTVSSSPILTINGINFLSTKVKLKKYMIGLNVVSSNFLSNSSCNLFSPIAGLGIRIKPRNFVLGPSSSSRTVMVTIPLSKTVKKLERLNFKAKCGNGTEAEKVISLE